MTLQDFFNNWSGKQNNNGSYPGQCVNLIKSYFQDVLGLSPFIGNAIDYWNNPPQGFSKIKNTPFNSPLPGDLVIWNIPPYGHIDICSSANIFSLTSFSQNWPIGSPCGFVKHNYKKIIGWLRPLNPPVLEVRPLQIAFIGLNLPLQEDFKTQLALYSQNKIRCVIEPYNANFTGVLTQDQAYKLVDYINPREKFIFIFYQGAPTSIFYTSYSYPKRNCYITTCPAQDSRLLIFELGHQLIKAYNENRGNNPYLEDIDYMTPTDDQIRSKLISIIPYLSIITR